MTELDKKAEAYMRSVMQNDGDVFTRSDLYEYIIEAWKQGYVEGATTANFLQCQDCPKRVKSRNFGNEIIFINPDKQDV